MEQRKLSQKNLSIIYCNFYENTGPVKHNKGLYKDAKLPVFLFFFHFKLELLIEFPAWNDKKLFLLMKNIHYWIQKKSNYTLLLSLKKAFLIFQLILLLGTKFELKHQDLQMSGLKLTDICDFHKIVTWGESWFIIFTLAI